jgi:hypothetical protein
MEDVSISKFRAQVVRSGSTPASPGFVVSEGQDPVNPSGSNNFVPYSGAIADVNLGNFDLYTNKLWLYDGPNDAYGSIYLADSSMHFEDIDGNTIFLVEDGFVQIHLTPTIQSNIFATELTTTRDHYLPNASGTFALTSQLTGGTVTSVGLSSATSGVTIGSSPITTSGTITLAIATASGSQNGLLSSTDWTTFNGKQNALTNPVTGTGTSGQVAYFTGTSAISSESNLFWDATNDRLGIGTALPNSILEISAATPIFRIQASDTSNFHGIEFRQGAGLDAFIKQQPNSGEFRISNGRIVGWGGFTTFYNDTVEAMRIFSGGNVFIGSSPSNAGFKLDVNGTGRFSGALTGTSATFSGLLTRNSTGVTQAVKITTSGTAGFNAITIEDSNPAITDFGVIGVTSTANKWFLGWQASPGTLGNVALTWDKTGSISVTSGATFTGDVTISKTSPTFRITRGNTSSSSLVVYNTNGTDDWLIGTGVTGTNSDYRIYNNGLGADAIYIVKSNNNVLIGTATSGASKLRIVGLPTSAVGLSSGDVYNLAGVLMIA